MSMSKERECKRPTLWRNGKNGIDGETDDPALMEKYKNIRRVSKEKSDD